MQCARDDVQRLSTLPCDYIQPLTMNRLPPDDAPVANTLLLRTTRNGEDSGCL